MRTQGLGKTSAVGVMSERGNLMTWVGATHQRGEAGGISSESRRHQLFAVDDGTMARGAWRNADILKGDGGCAGTGINASGLGDGEQQPAQAARNRQQQRVGKRDHAEDETAQADSDSIHKDPRRTRSDNPRL